MELISFLNWLLIDWHYNMWFYTKIFHTGGPNSIMTITPNTHFRSFAVVVDWLVQRARKERSPMALFCLGLVAHYTGSAFVNAGYLEQLFLLLRGYLPARRDVPVK